jgi:hypothetical protein
MKSISTLLAFLLFGLVSQAQFITVNDTLVHICKNESTTLNANAPGALSITWTSQGLSTGHTGSNFLASPDSTTLYLAVADYGSGLLDTARIWVYVELRPKIWLSDTVLFACKDVPVTLEAHGAQHYSWSGANTQFSTTSDSTTIFTPDLETYFQLSVSGWNNACTTTLQVPIDVNDTVPSIVFDYSSLNACPDKPARVKLSGAQNYKWLTPGAVYVEPNTYDLSPDSVHIMTDYVVEGRIRGCVGTATIGVTGRPAPTLGIHQSSQGSPICKAARDTVSFTGTSTSFTLTAPTYVLNTAYAEHILAPEHSGWYSVQGFSDFKCKSPVMSFHVEIDTTCADSTYYISSIEENSVSKLTLVRQGDSWIIKNLNSIDSWEVYGTNGSLIQQGRSNSIPIPEEQTMLIVKVLADNRYHVSTVVALAKN